MPAACCDSKVEEFLFGFGVHFQQDAELLSHGVQVRLVTTVHLVEQGEPAALLVVVT